VCYVHSSERHGWRAPVAQRNRFAFDSRCRTSLGINMFALSSDPTVRHRAARHGPTRYSARTVIDTLLLLIYFKHRRQRAEATFMPVKSVQ